jgi:hypothetical protein
MGSAMPTVRNQFRLLHAKVARQSTLLTDREGRDIESFCQISTQPIPATVWYSSSDGPNPFAKDFIEVAGGQIRPSAAS